MNRWLRSSVLEAGLLAVLSIFLFSGLDQVPFHPDEASLLFQSRDLEALVTDPLAMAWTPSRSPSADTTYRLLNAPLPKYILGLGRALAGYGSESVSVDWDWSRSWDGNVEAGALPPDDLLLAARLASATALLGAVVILYLVGRAVAGRAAGLAAAAFLGVNALALLHGRRAMAEGTLLLAVSVALWGLLSAGRRPFVAGLAMAVAASAKFSTLALLPVGGLAVVFGQPSSSRRLPAALRSMLLYLLGFVVLTFALNPILWKNPWTAAQRMLAERRELLARQVSDLEAMAPDHVPGTAAQRAAVLIGNLYIAPLQYAEVGNYSDELQPSIVAYEADFTHTLLRGSIGGGVLMALTLLGWVWAWLSARRTRGEARLQMMWLFAAMIAQGVALVALVPLPFQRYGLPLLPFLCLWTALGLTGGRRSTETNRRPDSRAAASVVRGADYSRK